MEYLRNDRLPMTNLSLIVLTLAFSMSLVLTSMQQSFSEKTGSLDISLVNSSFVPLSNTEANQVKVNVKYSLENEKMQNQLINAVMEIYAPNGTLIRTTSIGSGFTLQSNEGEQLLKTSLKDKSLQSVSIKIILTDLSKKIPLSNTITKHLKLEQ
jgi:flagellar basal body-associated protein FliL